MHWRDGSLLNSPTGRLGLYVGAAGRPPAKGFVSIDLVKSPGLGLVGDIESLPFDAATFDMIECPAVLEHVRNPSKAVAEFFRVLRPGGILHIAIPFCHPFHAYPEDHHRWTRSGLRLLVGDFEIVDEGVLTGPTATLLAFFLEYLRLWFPEWAGRYVYAAAGWVLWPLRYLDVFLDRSPRSYNLANTIWIHARRPR